MTFKAERWDFTGYAPEPLEEWLQHLPQKDPKSRFTAEQVDALLRTWRARRAKSNAEVLGAVVEANEKERRVVADKVRAEILALPEHEVRPADSLAILTYSVELYQPLGPGETTPQPCEHQIYGEFNAVCRRYFHDDAPPEAVRRDWELFKPLAYHLDAAVRALPPVQAVLYRGANFAIDTALFPIGARGAWGGCMSASGDRLQAIGFVTDALKATRGCYFVVLTVEGRPMYHLSAFPEEVEYLHPLDQQLEVCGVLPVSILQMLSLNISIVTLKLAGRALPLDLHFAALDGLAFIYDEFFASYVPPLVKAHPLAIESDALEVKIVEFVQQRAGRVLLISAPAGVFFKNKFSEKFSIFLLRSFFYSKGHNLKKISPEP